MLPSGGNGATRGADVTFVDAERRVGRGVGQIPGGKAVFPSMTVVDNMRVFATSSGRGRHTAEAAIDTCFEAFPRLASGGTIMPINLSGGQQQMLALWKAVHPRPQLLLIDELSLGLAPQVVGELLEMVRNINATARPSCWSSSR